MQKNKGQWKQWLIMIGFILIGAVCGMLMVGFVDSITQGYTLAERLLAIAALIVFLYVGVFLQLVIHEAGHLVCGLWSGYRFSSFRIGSIMWVKSAGKIQRKKLSLAGTGGQCLMAPPELVDGKIPVVLYNLGGCLMNLAISVLCWILYFVTGRQNLVAVFFLMMAVIGIVIALTNGVPLRLGTVDNDGYNALSLGKNPQAMEALWLQLKINEQTAQGLRLRDMPDEWFQMPDDEAMKNSMVATRGVFICNRLMDQRRFDQADMQMERLLGMDSGMVGLHRSLLICDRVYCELIGQNRTQVVRDYLTKEQLQFMHSMRNFPSVIRTQYTLALLDQRNEKLAAKHLTRFERVSKTYPYSSDIRAERELMELAAEKG